MKVHAKFEGKCEECGEPILVGEEIWWEKGEPAVHFSCYEDFQRNAASPVKPVQNGTVARFNPPPVKPPPWTPDQPLPLVMCDADGIGQRVVTLTVDANGFEALEAVVKQARFILDAAGARSPGSEHRITTPRYVNASGEFRLELALLPEKR